MRLLVRELHNFGGFFGGDTVTLSGVEWRAEGAAERTLTIDEAALTNVRERHTLAVGMLLELSFAGERVERAALLGAAGHAELRRALGVPAPPAALDAPLVLSHRCDGCGLWVPTLHDPDRCPVCESPVGR